MSSSDDIILPVTFQQNSYNTDGNTYVECQPFQSCPPSYPCATGSINTGSYSCSCDGVLTAIEYNCTAPSVKCPTVPGFNVGKPFFLNLSATKLPFEVVCPYYFNPSSLSQSMLNAWQESFPYEKSSYDVLLSNYCLNPNNLHTPTCDNYCKNPNHLCVINYEFYCQGPNLNTKSCKDYCFNNGQKCTNQLNTYCLTDGAQKSDVCQCYLGGLFYDVNIDVRTKAITSKELRKRIIDHLSKLPPSCTYPNCALNKYRPDSMPTCSDNFALCLLKYNYLYDEIFKNETDPNCEPEFKKLYDKYLKPKPSHSTSTTTTTVTKKPSKPNYGLIIGLTLGLLFLIGIGIFLYFILRKKKEKH